MFSFSGFAKVLVAMVAAGFMGTVAFASEPVTSSYILGKLMPITGEDEGRSIDLQINFELGSAKLSQSATAQLDALGQALMSPRLVGAQIGVYGHTDASGRASYNQKLSEQRAASVKAYLIQTFNIAPDLLFSAGYGEDKLKNEAQPNAAENRRVQIVNLTPPKSMPVQNPAQPAAEAMPAMPAMPAPLPEGGGMQTIN
ncbi:MAG: OmpA family protein [Rhodospirillales bacterium]|jgi:hypothetical protein|nr:OmpA family protein [Rhodospirillales bacterium]